MYRNRTWKMALCLAAILWCGDVRANYETGQAAWQAGRHAEALTQWREAARAGDGKAMLALGRAFARGLGVPQDYVLAHMWLNLAAGRGSAEAARERDGLAANMIPQHIASAQERARAWLSGRGADAPKAAAVPRAAAPTAAAGPPPPRAIREAQGLMAVLGYKPGSADGRWGPRTGRAYAAFLRDAGMPPGNVLTPDAMRAMRAAAKGRNVTASAAPPRAAPVTQRKADRPPADLHRLVAAGDIDGLKAALAAGADANARDGKGWTPLMHAADKGHTLLIPPLLEAGADLDTRLADGATALFIAAVHRHSEIVTALMKAGADFSIKGPNGKTAADVARERYGGLDQARNSVKSTELLALLEQGRPSASETEKSIRKSKRSIENGLLKCSMIARHSSRTTRVSVASVRFMGDNLQIDQAAQDLNANNTRPFRFSFALDWRNVEVESKYGVFWYKNNSTHYLNFTGNHEERHMPDNKWRPSDYASFQIGCEENHGAVVVKEFHALQQQKGAS